MEIHVTNQRIADQENKRSESQRNTVQQLLTQRWDDSVTLSTDPKEVEYWLNQKMTVKQAAFIAARLREGVKIEFK